MIKKIKYILCKFENLPVDNKIDCMLVEVAHLYHHTHLLASVELALFHTMDG